MKEEKSSEVSLALRLLLQGRNFLQHREAPLISLRVSIRGTVHLFC
jgi:hypothetical protein